VASFTAAILRVGAFTFVTASASWKNKRKRTEKTEKQNGNDEDALKI
jgi:hypothetical protein